MDWNSFRKYYKNLHGATSSTELSKAYKNYKDGKSVNNKPVKTKPLPGVFNMAGWSQEVPKRGKERKELKEKCGDEAFLRPSNLGFPIMTGKSAGASKCQVSCKGVAAARVRACQWNYFGIAEKATKIGIEKCGWPVYTPPCRKGR
jgi:hypothetical protein